MATNYAKWDKFEASDDDDDAATAPPAVPQRPERPSTTTPPADSAFDPSRVSARRALLDEIDDERRPALLAAVKWLEDASECFKRGALPDDERCPFMRRPSGIVVSVGPGFGHGLQDDDARMPTLRNSSNSGLRLAEFGRARRQGDDAWFWFLLMANKPHATLRRDRAELSSAGFPRGRH